MYTRTSLANLALTHLGDLRISDIDQPGEVAAMLRDNFDHAAKFTFEAHEWRFAMRQAELAPLPDREPFRYKNAFSLPPHFARFGTISDNDTLEPPLTEWAHVGDMVCADAARLFTEYVATNWNVAVWTAAFADCFACRLASIVAPRIHGALTTRDKLEAEFTKTYLPRARTMDSQGQPPRRAIRSAWRAARFGRTSRI